MTMLRIFQPSRTLAPRVHPVLWNNLFESFLDSDSKLDTFSGSVPHANVIERDNSYVLELFVPGMSKEEIKLDLNANELVISAKSDKKDEEKYFSREFNYQEFKRAFIIPEDVKLEEINASYSNGILQVILPKHEKTPQIQRAIEIS